ncbi:MAG: tripartite tricarboxylate transporter substrate binding protein [Pseudomonadota bacterium]
MLIATLALPASGLCFAQAYPTKPIRFIVPFSAGGASDIIARIVQPKLSEGLGQPVVIDNRGGAAGIIGTALAAKADPDGYTILVVPASHSVNASLYARLPYDSVKDFAPVAMLDIGPQMLAVHPSLPAKSVATLIRLAKAQPGSLHYSSGGVGAGGHLSGELFESMAGVDLVHVPYKGVGPALVDLIAGYTQLVFSPLLPVLPHVKSGRLRALAVTSTQRLPEMPDVPTVAETVRGYEAIAWHGVLVPARTPPSVVQRLNAEINRVLSLPDVRKSLSDQGLQAVGGTPGNFVSYIQQDIVKFSGIIRKLGLRVEYGP